MTPTPAAGDIWEWTGVTDPGLILLLRYYPADYWIGLNLGTGLVEKVCIHKYNIKHWRVAA